MTGEEIIDFLECSFGVFQMRASGAGAGWDRHGLESALSDLLHRGMIERLDDGRLNLTDRSRLAGESAIEIETLLRAVDCLRRLRPEEVTDPGLIALAQTSVELDEVSIPVNKKSTQKEPQHWAEQLLRQGISRTILGFIQRSSSLGIQAVTRSKKAAVCLYYISGIALLGLRNTIPQVAIK